MIAPEYREIDGKTFILTKFPATKGREIVTQYLATAIPNIGDYKLNEALMLKLMSFVGIPRENGQPPLMLTTDALVDNHVPNFETLLKIEYEMMRYNCDFFQNGRASTLLSGIAHKVPAWIIKTLTRLLQQLSETVKPPYMN